MNKHKIEIEYVELSTGYKFIALVDPAIDAALDISSHKIKRAAYLLAAAKLRKLADEAERLANE